MVNLDSLTKIFTEVIVAIHAGRGGEGGDEGRKAGESKESLKCFLLKMWFALREKKNTQVAIKRLEKILLLELLWLATLTRRVMKPERERKAFHHIF